MDCSSTTTAARSRRQVVQVRALIVFRRQMFGRIFAISPGVRAHFAPGPCAFGACARRSATREKLLGVARFFAFSEQNKFGRGAGGEGEKGADKWKVVSPSRLLYQYHLIKFPTVAQLIAARMARGEENFGVGRRSVGNSLFRRRVRRLFPYFGAACRNTISARTCIGRARRGGDVQGKKAS